MPDEAKYQNDWHFTIIENNFLDDERLTPTDRLVFVALNFFANVNTGTCWPSYEGIAKKSGFSTRSVIRSIKKLAEHGYIAIGKRIEENGQKTNIYTILNYQKLNNGSTTRGDTVSQPTIDSKTPIKDQEMAQPHGVTQCHGGGDTVSPELLLIKQDPLKDINPLYKKNIKERVKSKKEPKYSKEAHELTIHFLTILKERSNYEPVQKGKWFASNHKYADEFLRVYSVDEAKEIINWGLDHSFHGKNFNTLLYIERFLKEYLDHKKGGADNGRTRTHQKPDRRPLTAEDYDEPEYRDLIRASDRKLEKLGIMPKVPPGDQELP